MAFNFITKKVFDNSPLVDVPGCETDSGETVDLSAELITACSVLLRYGCTSIEE